MTSASPPASVAGAASGPLAVAPDLAVPAASTEPGDAFDHDVFIVHAADDAAFVRGELLPMLNLAGDRVVLSSALPFPAFTEQAIEAAVRRSRLTVAVVSPAYLRDRWAGFAELLSRNVHDDGRGGSLVPLVIADCDVPATLAQYATLDGRTPAQREAAAARLRDRLGRPAPLAAAIHCPYPGMQPFSAATSARFHGREGEIDTVLGRLGAGERELYVIGPSGSGKSSLIAAGVIPRVGDIPGARFAVRALRPGEHPAQRLAEALGGAPENLAEAAGRLLAEERRDRLLVFVDQLEELFTLADAGERDRFVRALRVLRADRRCHLIAALRADFYGALMSSELWPDIEGRFTRLEVAPLRGEALRRAIEAPALSAGVYLERDLVERLMSDTAAEPGALPLLQEALVLLWARRRHRLLRLASYEALDGEPLAHTSGVLAAAASGHHQRWAGEPRSGISVALARRADAALHELTSAQQRVAQRIFLRLVSFGEGRPDTRRQQPRAALAACGSEDAGAGPVIDRLIDARLLISDATRYGEPLVDLAHEALIAGWPELQHWLRSRRDDEQRRRLLELHAAQWVQRGRGSVGLFDAIELAEAERWIAGDTARELGYSDDLLQFLAASRDAIAEAERQRRVAHEERAQQRRRIVRFSIVALALFATVASSLGLVAWRQRQEAEHQRQEAERQRQEAQHQLARNELEQARAFVVERRDAPRAIPHLVEAARLGLDTRVLRTLLVTAGRGLWRVQLRHGGIVWSAAFSPDGAQVVTASLDGSARVWDAATGNPVGVPLQHEQGVASAAFSPDGTQVVTASLDGSARVWNAVTGNPVGIPLQHEQGVASAAFSPDGTRVVTASDDGSARVWDAATGNPVGVPLKHEKEVWSAAFSPDGTRVVTASLDGSARVWDAATGDPVGVPLKHEKEVWSAAFSPDGTRVVTASWDGSARVWDAATGHPVGVPLKHERKVWSAAFSPDGMRVVTASWDGSARVWQITETGALAVWVQQATSCVATQNEPAGSARVCQLAEHPATAIDRMVRARALVASGDRDLHSHIWSTPRARYRQALSLLEPSGQTAPPQKTVVELRRAISMRLAMLAAIEGRVSEARTRFGSEAPEIDANLLAMLGDIAHHELNDELVAEALLRRAHELAPSDPAVLAELAKVYFASGQMQLFARAAAQIDLRRASLDVRVGLAALTWARGRLIHTATSTAADQLLRVYRQVATGAHIRWSWRGTKHALTYGCHRSEDVVPVVVVLALLEQPITDDTRRQLATLLVAPARSRRSQEAPPR